MFFRKVINRIDNWLLINRPLIWRAQLHRFVLYSLIIANVILLGIGTFLYQNEDHTFYWAKQINRQATILIILAVPLLTLWVLRLKRFQVGYRSSAQYWYAYIIYFICLLLILVNVFSLTGPLIYKVEKTAHFIPDEEFDADYSFHLRNNFWCCEPNLDNYRQKELIDVVDHAFRKYELIPPVFLFGYSNCDTSDLLFDMKAKDDGDETDLQSWFPCLIIANSDSVTYESSIQPFKQRLDSISTAKLTFKDLFILSSEYIVAILFGLALLLSLYNLPGQIWYRLDITRWLLKLDWNLPMPAVLRKWEEQLSRIAPQFWLAQIGSSLLGFVSFLVIFSTLVVVFINLLFPELTIISYNFINESLGINYFIAILIWTSIQKRMRFEFNFHFHNTLLFITIVSLFSVVATVWNYFSTWIIDPLQLNYFDLLLTYRIYFSINWVIFLWLFFRNFLKYRFIVIPFLFGGILLLVSTVYLLPPRIESSNVDLSSEIDLNQLVVNQNNQEAVEKSNFIFKPEQVWSWSTKVYWPIFLTLTLLCFISGFFSVKFSFTAHVMSIFLYFLFPYWWFFELLNKVDLNPFLHFTIYFLMVFLVSYIFNRLLHRPLVLNAFNAKNIKLS